MPSWHAVKLVGRYELGEPIGHGGMAVVYLARQVDLDRQVALKELRVLYAPESPDQAERFLREARMAGSLSHPNIVTVHEYFKFEGTPYIAMEYLERGSLRPWIGRMTMAQIAGVLEGLLAALDHAESYRIVHRDLKPENVLVTRQGQVKVADFGIAKAATMNDGTLTVAGSTVGTPTYMSPEQAMARELGPPADLYSIGVMAYEMLVGRVPFHDTMTPLALAMRHVSEEIPSAHTVRPDIDPALSSWIDQLLIKDPKRRTQTAAEAWDELETFIAGRLGSLWRREARLITTLEQPAEPPLTPAPFATSLQTPTPEHADTEQPPDEYEDFDFDRPLRVVPTPPPLVPPTPRHATRSRPPTPSEPGFVTFDRAVAVPETSDKLERHVAVVTPPPAVREAPAPVESQATPAEVDETETESVIEPVETPAASAGSLVDSPAEVAAPVDDPRSAAFLADVEALTISPDAVPSEVPLSPGREPERAPEETPAPARAPTPPSTKRRRVLVAGGGAAAVAAVAVAVALSLGGGNKPPAPTPPPTKPATFELTTGDLALTLPASWSGRTEFPAIPGLREDRGAAAADASKAYIVADLVPGDADVTLVPDALRSRVKGKLGDPQPVTLGGRETLVYDGVRIRGAKATLRVYATLTSGGVATIVCASPATAATCDAAAGSMRLSSASALSIGPSDTYRDFVTSASKVLDGRIAKWNEALGDAKTPKGRARAVGRLGHAYTSAIALLGGKGAKAAERDLEAALNPVDARLNDRLTARFAQMASAYTKLAAAVRTTDRADARRYMKTATRIRGRIVTLRGAFAEAGYTGLLKVKPKTKVTLPPRRVATPVATGPAITQQQGPVQSQPPAPVQQSQPPAAPPPAAPPPAAPPPPPGPIEETTSP